MQALYRYSRLAFFLPARRVLSSALSTDTAASLPSYLNRSHVPQPAPTWPTCTLDSGDTPYAHLKDRPYLTQRFPYQEKAEVLYEITLEVDEDIVPDYLDWIRSGHIQETLSLPGFLSWEISSVEEGAEARTKGKGGKNRKVFVERYIMSDREALEDYFTKYAAGIRADHSKMWDGKVAASRTIQRVFGLQDEKDTKLWKAREERNMFRLKNLEHQVANIQKFTDKGYRVLKTPAPLWNKIQSFFEGHKHEAVLEHIDPIEVSINTWVAPTYKLDYPKELVQDIYTTLTPLLEEWTGIASLEPMGISGVRFYQPGAIIAEHVDLANTSVISALIHISHEVDEPWPLEVKTHAGTTDIVDLSPGEMIIYESAACSHARRAPLKGAYYANSFMRFRPVGWDYHYTY